MFLSNFSTSWLREVGDRPVPSRKADIHVMLTHLVIVSLGCSNSSINNLQEASKGARGTKYLRKVHFKRYTNKRRKKKFWISEQRVAHKNFTCILKEDIKKCSDNYAVSGSSVVLISKIVI